MPAYAGTTDEISLRIWSADSSPRLLASSGLTFTTRPLGLMRYATFMCRIGMIAKQPDSWKSLVFPPVYSTKGS